MRNLKLTDNPGSAPKICSELESQTQSGPSISLDANFASGKCPGTSSSVQSLNCVQLFETPWTTAYQASLSITNSWSLCKLMSIKSVIPSNHVILCYPLLFPPSIFPSIRIFSNESVLHIRWPKYWSFSFSISPSNEYSGLISFKMDLLDLLAVQGTGREPYAEVTTHWKWVVSTRSQSRTAQVKKLKYIHRTLERAKLLPHRLGTDLALASVQWWRVNTITY